MVDPVPLAVPGVELSLFLHDEHDQFVSPFIREHGLWEPYETELVRRSLKAGDRVLDAGANIGYFSVLAGAWVGQAGRVYAFEPAPENVQLLRRNIDVNGLADRGECVAAALSDQAGEGTLHLSPENLGDHQLHAGGDERDSVRVPLLQGSHWFDGRESGLDFVKIDVQGAEHEVVKGLLPLLQASGEGLRILLELTPLSLREAGTSGRALIETLATLGLPFAIVDHVEHQLAPVTAEALATWCDNIDSCPEDAGFMNIFVGAPV